MSKKKSPAEKDLASTVKKLKAQLERSRAKAQRWKRRAANQAASVATLTAQVKKLEKRNRKLTAAPDPAPAETAPASPPVSDGGRPEKPDAQWTVVALRAEARSRGLTGYSGKSKAELLAALS